MPLDFDAPLNETWRGYVMPDDVRPPDCTACAATGYGPTARWLHDTFYDHNVVGESGGWRDKLVQADVDALIEAGRLRKCVPREPTEDNPRAWEWVVVPLTAEEVNAANGRGQSFGSFGRDLHHDGINCHVLVESRCKRLGADLECAVCNGHAMVGTPAQLAAYEEWAGTEPPEGDGWQMWETTSEGSPQTPVFSTPEALADYCAVHCTWFADQRWTASEWLASFTAGTTDVDSLLAVRHS